jgi:nucleotide-binding universal stress UspA family protein
MASLERILVPTDFSAGSYAALGYAAFLASRLGAALEVVAVYDPVPALDPRTAVQTPGSAKPRPLSEILREDAEKKLRDFLSDVPGGQGVPITSRVECGPPAEVIVRVAREGYFDLIAMGTRGITGGAAVGSVVEKVIRAAPCPVLAVRVKG